MKRINIRRLFIYLLLLLPIGCTPNQAQIEYAIKQTEQAHETELSKQSGYELISYSEKYLNIAKVINRYILEGDYESAERLISEAALITEQISNLDVTPEYETAKEYLRNGTWLDGFSFVMMINNMPKGDYEDTMYDGMQQMYLFVKEMNRLGHDLKF